MIDILTGVVNRLLDRSGDNGWLRGRRGERRGGARALVQAEGAAEETEHHAASGRRSAAGDCRLLQVSGRERGSQKYVNCHFLSKAHGASAPRKRRGASRLINSV